MTTDASERSWFVYVLRNLDEKFTSAKPTMHLAGCTNMLRCVKPYSEAATSSVNPPQVDRQALPSPDFSAFSHPNDEAVPRTLAARLERVGRIVRFSGLLRWLHPSLRG
jgi:hypothetical protein